MHHFEVPHHARGVVLEDVAVVHPRAWAIAARALHRRAPIGQGLDGNLGTLVLERTDGQFDALGGRSRCAARRRLYSLPMTSPPFPESSSRSTARPTFSWKRGLLHAVLALVAVVVFGAALAGVLGMEGAAAREAGQAIGRLAGIIGGAAFGGSYLFQTRRRAGALALGLAFVALVGAGIVGGMMKRGRNRNTSLTAEEKAPMVIADEDGERRLRHPGFGFSLLHPGPKFLEAPELVKPKPGQKHDDTTQEYGFADREDNAVLLVSVMKGMGGTREQLVAHVDGVQRGFVESLPAAGPLHWGDKQVTWTDGEKRARLEGSFGADMRLELTAYSILRPDHEPFIVNVMMISPDAERFANVTGSLRLRPSTTR